MGLVFKFGDDDQMPPVPDNFPRCGDYLPDTDIPHQSVLHLPDWLKNLFTTSNSSYQLKSNLILILVIILSLFKF